MGEKGQEAASRSFVALQSLEIAQENEFLLQTIQLFSCCLLAPPAPPPPPIITLLLLAGLLTHKGDAFTHAYTLAYHQEYASVSL